MRLGGPFPFNPVGSFPVSLGSGQYFYPPPGNYLFTLGGQSVLQWWDPILSTWRNICPAVSPGAAVSVDGYNYRILNQSGVVQGAAITTAGSGGVNGIGPTQTGSTVTFAAPGGNGQQAKGYVIVGGAVGTTGGTATLTQAGSGFAVPPLILIDPPPPGGIQATAVSTITAGGALNSVTVVNPGAGYTSVPNFYVIPQFLDYPGQLALPYTIPATGLAAPNFPPGLIAGGAGPGGTGGIMPPQSFTMGLQLAFPITGGALVTSPALAGSGTLTGIVVTDYGSAYTSVPAVTFGGTSLGAAAATSLMSWCVTAIAGSGGAGYTVGNPVISSLGYLIVGGVAQRIVNNDYMLPREFHGVLTSTAGAIQIEDPGFGFQTVLAAGNFGVAQSTSIGGTSVTFSGVTMGGINDSSLLQMNVNE